jgi:molybdopterin molybdotransferase
MLTFHEALSLLNEINFKLPIEQVSLSESWNRILREEVFSDMNMPPFDKSAVDGYACRNQDLSEPLRVIGTMYAGNSITYTIQPGTCVKIMTGAPVPEGSDIVVMSEHSRKIDNDHIQFTKATSKSNICKLGEDVHKGEQLLDSGTLLLPHHLAILASAGFNRVKVSRLPRVALISTGNELVEPSQMPNPSQIRNSNAHNLAAQLKTLGIAVYYDGIIPDDKEVIRNRLKELFENYDMVILTGGASQGEHDFVPIVLEELHMNIRFNKLAIQPGKPVSFATGKDKFCFGLSGNPVSSYLQFELLVKPFLYHMMSHTYRHPIIMSELAERMRRKNAERLKFFPICFNNRGQAEELKFNGSAHIAGLSEADGFGLFPKDCEGLEPGDKIEILCIR